MVRHMSLLLHNLLAIKIEQRNVTKHGAWGGHFLVVVVVVVVFFFPFSIKNNVVGIVTVQQNNCKRGECLPKILTRPERFKGLCHG